MANPFQIGPVDAIFNADLIVTDPAGLPTNLVEVVAGLNPAANNNVTITADDIDIQFDINVAGTGIISLFAQNDLTLSTANSALGTAHNTIELRADMDQSGMGGFFMAMGTDINTGTGDLLISAADMEISGDISGGFVELLAASTGTDSGFLLGDNLRAPDQAIPAGASGDSIELSNFELDNIFAGTQLNLGKQPARFRFTDRKCRFDRDGKQTESHNLLNRHYRRR